MLKFPRVQSLRGELKRSEVRDGVRYQLTTSEFIYQRGNQTYRIALDDVIGVVECPDGEWKREARYTDVRVAGKPYKIVASLMHLVLPSGVIEQSQVSFYTRLSKGFIDQMTHLLSRAN